MQHDTVSQQLQYAVSSGTVPGRTGFLCVDVFGAGCASAGRRGLCAGHVPVPVRYSSSTDVHSSVS